MDDSPRRLSVWPTKLAVQLEDAVDEDGESDGREPEDFDPIPEVPPDASAETTDWSFALQDVFAS